MPFGTWLNPLLTWMLLLILSVGIGLNASIFSVVKALLMGSNPYHDPEQLVYLWESRPSMGWSSTSPLFSITKIGRPSRKSPPLDLGFDPDNLLTLRLSLTEADYPEPYQQGEF